MDRPTAEAHLRLFAAVEEEPSLAQNEIEIILDMARRPDAEDVVHTDATWVPTFDIHFAIVKAWEAKAAKAAAKYTFLQGGNQFIRSDMIRHCLTMAGQWRRGVHDSLLIAASQETMPLVYGGMI